MDLNEVARRCPAVLTGKASPGRSSRYGHVSTIECLEIFGEENWKPIDVQDTRGDPYGIHLVRLRKEGGAFDKNLGTEREAIIFNSHNGKKSLEILGGIFRFVCSNGLVIGDASSQFRRRHVGNPDPESMVAQALDSLDAGVVNADRWRHRDLDISELQTFGRRAAELVYDKDWVTDMLASNLVATTLRIEDLGTDLWRTFNRVQENVLSGGITRALPDDPKKRVSRTREIKDFARINMINRDLWDLASTFN
tara:strand:+ start:269 stop:1024 length:756 start_codon:yes stop_codon:yes gene_type:complete